ncbi:sulfite reductase subunit alpha [Lampropedia cohaerens]|uniref:NADPH--hemoprotein reductase n=1 Tax=Lampropedia cohaerens TaxID=1610491 RepID=A0A0U1Q250_9BURK|nr:sulfite reductase flavoprotein subunit alpha [Lampropedia cohaerens]KKW68822.1 sulfite reductase subunit alpha [Lampropedia cohaerens]
MDTSVRHRILIGYGSESGNARALAQRLASEPALVPFAPRVLPLNDVSTEALQGQQPLVIISSSFGDGEPPGNAERFLAQICQTDSLAGLRYAIFGLGDTGYPQFCGFTRQLDELLQQRQASPLINRVDADACYPEFFQQWLTVLDRVLQGDAQAGQELMLRVKAYGADNAFAAPILERKRLNSSEPGAFHVRLDCRDSGMVWRAGDALYVLPENEPAVLARLANWWQLPEDSPQLEPLRHKELRQLSKPVLRELARLSGSEPLKAMLKISQKKLLDDYLWGADLLDVLQDFCQPECVTPEALQALLSPALPRAYSIASHGQAGHIDLCIREVAYARGGRRRRGMATNWLLQHQGPVQVYCRSNPGFHLVKDTSVPLILIGTGTGIAPLMGLLREMQASGQQRKTCLIFGEKSADRDFLFKQELHMLQDEGVLGRLITAFSRDCEEKYYVQHAIAEHADHLRGLLQEGAHLYICGNKRHLQDAVAGAIDKVLGRASTQAQQPEERPWQTLQQQGRVHLELY